MGLTGNLTYYDVIEPCERCAEARKLAARLEQLVGNSTGAVRVSGRVVHSRVAEGQEVLIAHPRISCEWCGSTGYALKEAGKQVVQLLEQQGILPRSEKGRVCPPPAARTQDDVGPDGMPTGDTPIWEGEG